MGLFHTLAHLFHPRRSNHHRPRLLHPESYLFLCLIVVGFFLTVRSVGFFAPSWGSILGYASNISAGQVLDAVNSQRAGGGLGALVSNAQLAQAATAKGQDMFSNQYWAHTSPSGREPWDFIRDAGYRYTVAGENLARDFLSYDTMVSAWMASPTHRANIMNPRYSQTGIAVINGVLQGVETTLVVQMFGTPSGAKVGPSPTVSPVAVAVEVVEPVAPVVTTPPAQNPPPTPSPTPSPTPNITAQPVDESNTPSVLAQVVVPGGTILPTIVISPLTLIKAFFLAVIMLLASVLIYDLFAIGHRYNLRLVGKNLAHLMLLFTVAFLIIFFKGGLID